jgi:CheY-like chemotaxis protein
VILLVEDNADDVFLMKRVLQKLAVTQPMHNAINGQEAIDYFQALGKYSDRARYPLPSVVFLDLKMPFVNGFEVLEWLRKQPSLGHVPVAVLTSSPEESDREKAKQLGAKTFLVKPPSPEMLRDALKTLTGDTGSPGI